MHGGGRNGELGKGVAAAYHGANVVPDRTAGGCDHGDFGGKAGQFTLAGRLEQAFVLQLQGELLKQQLEFADAFGLGDVCDDLQIAALFVDGYAAVDDDGGAVGEVISAARAAAEHNAAQGCVCFAQAEV